MDGFFGAFYNFDYVLLEFWHNFATSTAGVFTFISVIFAWLGRAGIASIVLGVVLLFFKKTRRTGITVLVALLLGFMITNLTLKPIINRPRPYTVEPFRSWWTEVGSHLESDASFPSGHTTVAFETVTALFLTSKKKQYTWTYFLIGVAMCISRNILVVHYPSDVLFGAIVGVFAGTVAYFAVGFYLKQLAKALVRLNERKQQKLASESQSENASLQTNNDEQQNNQVGSLEKQDDNLDIQENDLDKQK